MQHLVHMVGGPGCPKRMVAQEITDTIRVRSLSRSLAARIDPEAPVAFVDHVFKIYPMWRRRDSTSWLAVYSRTEEA